MYFFYFPFLQMLTTSQRLAALVADCRTLCAYGSDGAELYLYNPATSALLHTVALAPTDAATFAAHNLPANGITQPLQCFLRALSFTEPAESGRKG